MTWTQDLLGRIQPPAYCIPRITHKGNLSSMINQERKLLAQAEANFGNVIHNPDNSKGEQSHVMKLFLAEGQEPIEIDCRSRDEEGAERGGRWADDGEGDRTKDG
jgi:hypothetical protein